MNQLLLSDLGEGLQDAEVVMWHVSVGDNVSLDQPIVSVETDKAVVEIPSPQKGVVKELKAEVGDLVKVGGCLMVYESDASEDQGTVVGKMEAGQTCQLKVNEPSVVSTAVKNDGGTVKAMPNVRQLAKHLGVDLSEVKASGHRGQVLASDLGGEVTAPDEYHPLRGVRKAMARHMERSRAEVVPVTITDFAVVHEWVAGEDVTARLIRAVVAGAQAAPALNAHYDTASMSCREFRSVHLGLAMDTADGLFVPVIRNAELLTGAELRETVKQMKQNVVSRSLAPEAFQGATISLSNYGMLAGMYATPIVVPPAVAILGAGRMHEALLAEAGEVVARRVIPLSLTFDHRAATGSECCAFLAAVIGDLQSES